MPGRNRNGELGSPLKYNAAPPTSFWLLDNARPLSMVGSPTSRVRNASPLQVLIVQQSKHGIVASGVRASNQTFGTPPHGSDDLVGIGGPAEGLGDVVALCDKALDHRLEIEERSERGVCDEYGGGQMRIRSLFILGGALLLMAANAFAGPKEDVAAATAKWGETLGQDDPDKVLALYATDAVLWGTLSPTVRSDRAALRDYFVSAFKILPGLKVSFGEQLIRVYGDTAVNTGYYTFTYTKDGESKTLPARYSIVFVKDGQNWMIVDHHSSAMPTPPR